MSTVAVMFAMASEARPFLDAIGAVPEPVDDGVPTRWWRAGVGGHEVVVTVNGHDRLHGVELIGTQPATLATHLTIARHRPDVIVSAGTAGGWAAHGTSIGTVFLSGERFWFHDRRIAIPQFEAYGLGGYPGLDTTALAEATGLPRGEVTTGNSLDETDACRTLMVANGAVAKDMEAAAVAWVANESGVAMFALKAITDLVDTDEATSDQFQANFAMATTAVSHALRSVLAALPHPQPPNRGVDALP